MARRSDIPPGVHESPPGSGRYAIDYRDENGKRHRETIGPLKLAVRTLEKRRNDILEGRHFPKAAACTVREAIQRYIAGAGVGKRSWKDDRHFAELWIEEFGPMDLARVTPGDVEAVRNRWAKTLARNTVNHRMSFLRRIYSVAIRDKLTKDNPVRLVRFYRDETSGQLRYLTEEEEAQLRAVFLARWWPVVEFAILTGLRQEEQFTLRWTQIDFAAGRISLTRTKSGKARHVPLHNQARAILLDLQARAKSEWVFVGARGKRLDGHHFYQRIYQPALEKSGLDLSSPQQGARTRDRAGLNWHSLRHTCGSRLVMAGVDIRTVQEILGHATLAMTQRYAHLAPQHVSDAINRIRTAPVRVKIEPHALQFTRRLTGAMDAIARIALSVAVMQLGACWSKIGQSVNSPRRNA